MKLAPQNLATENIMKYDTLTPEEREKFIDDAGTNLTMELQLFLADMYACASAKKIPEDIVTEMVTNGFAKTFSWHIVNSSLVGNGKPAIIDEQKQKFNELLNKFVDEVKPILEKAKSLFDQQYEDISKAILEEETKLSKNVKSSSNIDDKWFNVTHQGSSAIN